MSKNVDWTDCVEPEGLQRKSPGGVPAAGPVPCPQCGQLGGAGRFCGLCGAALWQTCPHCGVEMRACDRFCTACGTDVPSFLAREAETVRKKIAEARQLAAGHRYQDATAGLREVLAKSGDPRLAEVAQLAAAALAEIEAQHATLRQAAERRLERARKLRAGGRWREACQELEKIPVPLREAAAVALLDELAAMIQHEKQLREQIAAAIASKQLLELAPLVEQLHALRPDDAAAHKLAENLRRQMVLRAQQYAANARDTLAWRALQAIPSFVVDEPTQALRDEIEERVALREAIAEAPYATASLAGLVRRLAKLCPQDPAMPQWRKKLSERMEKAPEDPHLPAARWAAAKGDGRLGLPVEAWAYFARPQVVQEEAQRRLRQHPGQFFTALGLALEALGVTPLACELSPPREGLLARLPGLGRRGARAAWAVDLGSTAIKALRATQDGGSIRIDAVLRLPVPERAAENVEAYDEALREVAKLVAQSPALVCVGLPGRWLLGRFFEMPAMKGPAWEQALRHEAQHQLPLALEELCWHAVVVAELPATPEGPALRRVVLQAARRGQVEQLLAVCRAAGLSVARVQSEPLALHHAVQWELAKAGPSQSSASTLSEAVWVVDWGATQTHIIHSHSDRLVFRTLSLGTDAWAKRLGAAFGQRELAECRTLLMDPAKAPVYSKWQQAGMLAWEGLAGQIQRCWASFLYAQETQPRLLIGLGGGFQMHGVVAYLRRPAG